MAPAPYLRSIVLGSLLLCGCQTTSTHFDWDRNFDFSTLHSWSWLTTSPDGSPEDLVNQRIQRAIASTLEAKGFRELGSGGDFRVNWRTQRRDRMTASADYGYRDPNLTYWTGSYGPARSTVTYYEEGSLVVDVVDPAENRLIWRGTATRVLDDSPTPEEIDTIVKDAVEKLFASFPPK